MPQDDDKKEEEAIFKVDTIPPPDGNDAYSAPTKVGAMADSVRNEMMVAATAKAAELALRQAEKARAKAAAAREVDGPKSSQERTDPLAPRVTDVTEDDSPPRLYADEDEDAAATLLHKKAAPPEVPPQPQKRNTDRLPPPPPAPVMPLGLPAAPLLPAMQPPPSAAAPAPVVPVAPAPVPILPLVAGATIFVIGLLLYVFLR